MQSRFFPALVIASLMAHSGQASGKCVEKPPPLKACLRTGKTAAACRAIGKSRAGRNKCPAPNKERAAE